ncbi:hypothetical protein [Streptomyces sp. NPDC007940]
MSAIRDVVIVGCGPAERTSAPRTARCTRPRPADPLLLGTRGYVGGS